MKSLLMFTVLAGVASALTGYAQSQSSAPAATQAQSAACIPALNHKFSSLQGKPMDLCQLSGKVVLVVNTASYCGFTPQYEGLQALYDKYQARGLVVLGVPTNDFGKQEPGSNTEIAEFCERTYKVKFPMLEKLSVLEGSANPLHEGLAKVTGERPKWNFHKYLISRNGQQISSYGSKVKPDADELVKTVETLLAAK